MSDAQLFDADALPPIDPSQYCATDDDQHAPRILMLYGSLRDRAFSRLAVEEGARILRHLGADVKIFDPRDLPQVGGVDESHPKVAELRELAMWSEGMVWSSPERHGAMTSIMKSQIDWLPLAPIGGIRPTQGKTLAVMQVCGGSQSFNTVNQLRILGRWMRMVTIPNQSSVAKAWDEFDSDDRMKPSPYYNRIVDVMEELVKFTYMTRGQADLTNRYSERVESLEKLSKRVNMPKAVPVETAPEVAKTPEKAEEKTGETAGKTCC